MVAKCFESNSELEAKYYKELESHFKTNPTIRCSFNKEETTLQDAKNYFDKTILYRSLEKNNEPNKLITSINGDSQVSSGIRMVIAMCNDLLQPSPSQTSEKMTLGEHASLLFALNVVQDTTPEAKTAFKNTVPQKTIIGISTRTG